MKLLILVLSYNQPPFSNFMAVSQRTWDKSHHPNIDVVYYYGGNTSVNGKELSVDCTDDYNMMHWKLKITLDAIPYHDYDMIFRTNSCSYIVKDKILEVAKQLPKKNCYAGYHNGGYISGAGIFFTPDVLDILRNELTDTPNGAEDVLIGSLLFGRVPMLAENSRVDADCNGVPKYDSYHFRFKTTNDNNDRMRDVDNMERLDFLLRNEI